MGILPEQREEAGAGSSLTAANRPVATAAAQAAIPPSLQGDKVRFATVLFADLVGSTRLIAALDPEDARDTLDRALAIVTDAVRRFGGMVARVQGDGVRAVFRVSPGIEYHSLRSWRARRGVVEQLRGGALGIVPAPALRVGIHSGLVLLRRQQGDFGTVLDIVGQATHVAGGIEKRARPNSVAISASTLDLISEPCTTQPLDTPSQVDPDAMPATAELLAIDLGRGDWLSVKGSGRSPMVGREQALATINATLASVRDGQGGALAIIGEAGMGKSRLLLEAAETAQRMGLGFVVVHGNEMAREVPFGSLAPALRHISKRIADEAGRAALDAALSPASRACLDGLLTGSGTWLPDLPPASRRRIAAGTLADVLALAAGLRPLVVLADDCQYLDAESRLVLAALADRGAALRSGLIIAQRAQDSPLLPRLARTTIVLAPLDETEARQLVARLAETSPAAPELAPALVEAIIERAGGLPLAIDAFTGAALRHEGIDGTGRFSDQARLPARLESLFARRLDDLDEDAAMLCRLCATLGPAVPLERLRRLGPAAVRDTDGALAALLERRILQIDRAGQAVFCHQLLQEAAYRTLSRAQQRSLHRLIHDQLTSDPGSAYPASSSELAVHAEQAGMLAEAARHLWHAAQQAVSLAAIASVERIWRHAGRVAAKLDGAEGATVRARFSLLAIDALQQLSLEQEAREDMQALAEGRIDLGSDARTIARINLALLDWIDGAPLQARHWLARANEDLAAAPSLPRQTFADIVGAYLDYTLAEPDRAISRIERLTDRLRDGLAGESFGAVVVVPHILALSCGGGYAADLGRMGLARRWTDEAMVLSAAQGHAYSQLLARLARGFLCLREGRTAEALATLREAHDHCLRHSFFGFEPACVAWLAIAALESGAPAEARQCLADSIERGHFRRIRTSATYYHFEARARLALADGHALAALDLARAGLDHCRAVGEAMHEHHALVLIEDVMQASGAAPGRSAQRKALRARLEQLGLAPLQARLERLMTEADSLA